MSSVGSKGVIIQDALGGDAVTVTDGRLDVNALIGATVTVALDSAEDSVECIQDTAADLQTTANLAIGGTALTFLNSAHNALHVGITDGTGAVAAVGTYGDLKTSLCTIGGSPINTSVADTVTVPNLNGEVLMGTHALLMAREDADTTVGLTSFGTTHKALHVALSNGSTAVADIKPATNAEIDLDNVEGLVTHALLSARKDDSTTIGLTCEDSTHNALHVAISDGAEIALVDATGALHTTHGITGMVSDRNTNISDSTAEQLNSATDGSYDEACKRVDLQASLSNTGYILVGDSGIVANLSGGGIKLNPGDFYSMDVNNVGDIYVLAETDTEDIFYTYFT